MNKASSYMIILILTQILIPIITPILPNNQNNLQLIFNPPTPSNNTLITNDYVPLNLSIIGEAFSITLDWNKSLLLYLPLDENNGQTIHDLSTYNNSGTLGWTISQEACDPAWINGISGSALEFNGNNIAIIPYKSNYKYLRSELSIDLWIKPYRIDNVDIIEKPNSFLLKIENGRIIFRLKPDWRSWITAFISNQILEVNRWYHIIVNWNGSYDGLTRIYINGSEITPAHKEAVKPLLEIPNTPIKIGNNFHGIIDEIKIQSRTLNLNEINASHNPQNNLFVNMTDLIMSNYTYYVIGKKFNGEIVKTDKYVVNVNSKTLNIKLSVDPQTLIYKGKVKLIAEINSTNQPIIRNIVLKFYINNTYICRKLAYNISNTIKQYNCLWNSRPGNHKFKLKAYCGRIVWINEINFTIPYPDLIIENVSWTPYNPKANQKVTLNIKVKNIGEGDLYNPRSSIKLLIDDNTVGEIGFNPNIIQVNSTSIAIMNPVIQAGNHTLKLIIDPYNNIIELNETNNIYQFKLPYIPYPNIKIKDLKVIFKRRIGLTGNWKYNLTSQPFNWTKLNFNDNDWIEAQIPIGDTNYPSTYLDLNGKSVYLRKKFFLDKNESSHYLLCIASDDGVDVWINGIMVLSDSASPHSYTYWNYKLDVTNYLNDGLNIIAIYQRDFGGANYFDIELFELYKFEGEVINLEDITPIPCGKNYDVEWKYTTIHPIGNWTNLNYNDANWTKCKFPIGDTWGIKSYLNLDGGSAYFRKIFYVNSTLNSVFTLYIASDDGVDVWINDVMVLNDSASLHGYIYWNYKLDVTNYIRDGLNVIAIYLADKGKGSNYLDIQLTRNIKHKSLVIPVGKDFPNINWKYTLTYPGIYWTYIDFDDSNWLEGSTPIGDASECRTHVDLNGKSMYLRKKFYANKNYIYTLYIASDDDVDI